MDIALILFEEETLPCSLVHEARHLAWLDPSSRQNLPLPTGTQLTLPLWLAKGMGSPGHAELELPRCFSDSYRKGMKAEAAHMDLRAASDFFFEFGVELARFVSDADLEDRMLKAFITRFHDLLKPSLNATPRTDVATCMRKLTAFERELFDAGRLAMQGYARWRAKRVKIERSQYVRRKRRRGGM